MAEVVRGVTALQTELEKAKESLKDVDENIKKLTGRDPTEQRSGAQRRVSLGMSDGRGRDARPDRLFQLAKRGIMEDEGPRAKRRITVGTAFSRLGPRPYGLGQRGRDSGDEDELPNRPTLQSSVIATSQDPRSRQASIEEQTRDKKGQARNRRMFGLIIGTLQRFKDDAKESKEKEEQRKEIEKKLEEKFKQEKEDIIRERRQLFQARKQKQLKIKLIEQKMELAHNHEKWRIETRKLDNFIRTKARPHLFFMPKILTPEAEAKLKDTEKAVDDMIDQRRKKLEEEIAELMSQAHDGDDEDEEDEEEGEEGQRERKVSSGAREQDKENKFSDSEYDSDVGEDDNVGDKDETLDERERRNKEREQKDRDRQQRDKERAERRKFRQRVRERSEEADDKNVEKERGHKDRERGHGEESRNDDKTREGRDKERSHRDRENREKDRWGKDKDRSKERRSGEDKDELHSRKRHGSHSREKHRSRERQSPSRSHGKRRSDSKERHRSKSREGSHSKERHRSKSRERKRSQSRQRHSSRRSHSKERHRSRSRERRRYSSGKSRSDHHGEHSDEEKSSKHKKRRSKGENKAERREKVWEPMEDEVEEEFDGARKEGVKDAEAGKEEIDIYSKMEKMYREAEIERERKEEQARARELAERELAGGDNAKENQTATKETDTGVTVVSESDKKETDSSKIYQHSFSEMPLTIPGLDLIGPDSGLGS